MTKPKRNLLGELLRKHLDASVKAIEDIEQEQIEAGEEIDTRNVFVEPPLNSAQMSYAAYTSEWRHLTSVRNIVRHHAPKMMDKFIEREKALREAHVREMQICFQLDVTDSTVGFVSVNGFDPELEEAFLNSYFESLCGRGVVFGRLGNLARMRDQVEDTMAVGSLVTLAASKMQELHQLFLDELAKQQQSDDPDNSLFAEYQSRIAQWATLLFVKEDAYPFVNQVLLTGSYHKSIRIDVIDYLRRYPRVLDWFLTSGTESR